ncbi:hypothetical protein [Streptomyces sp. NRRL S-340]|uniref:hypothetical protein n=1 Tax=Streptomyces sp. NRRL S-340 TaxID=1463901 RepID=UPI0005636DD9|nr:hypothetical protein [Streptomyces sp. NRRL S-340]
MRTQQQPGNGTAKDDQQGRRPSRLPGPAPSGAPSPSLLALQRAAGNAATTRALRGRGRQPAPAINESTEQGLALPPYLADLTAAGLSTAYGLTGHAFVREAVTRAVGHGGGTVDEIAAELAGRPETFFGQGRAFAVPGASGTQWFDVTVTVSRAPDDEPPLFLPAKDIETAVPDQYTAPLAPLDEAVGKDTKVDVQHNTAATASTSAGGSSSHGLGGTAFGLAPVAPGLWLGAAATAGVHPWQSSRETRGQRNVAEPRVLRSDSGSVEVPRKIRYGVRVRSHDGTEVWATSGPGTLTQRVPTEHLVPARGGPQADVRRVGPDTARRVSLADSLAPLGVTDTAAPHQGGGGLFDAVASVLHPSLTAPGAPGRARLYAVTSTTSVLEDLPRLLRDGVLGEDLESKDGRTAGSYRMSAQITGLAPAWSTGKTQLRTHQQTQHTVTDTAGKGRALAGGVGPAAGVGAAGNAAVVRGTVMPVAAARSARFTVAEQSVTSRQGAEVRGEKVLYRGTVQLTVEGTGPRSARSVLNPRARVAVHTMDVLISLRADEAQDLGLQLPPGVRAGEFVRKPTRTVVDAEGREKQEEVERHLPFGAMGSSVALSALDTRPMIQAVQQLFVVDPRLAGYLPSFGADTAPTPADGEEAAAQRHNQRELMAALSETNLRVNKDQLLSTGIRVRLRRKSTLHSHDVQIRVKGTLGKADYLGDTEDWLVRSHSGVTSNSQSGRSSTRSIGGMVLGQARLAPGALTASARYDRGRSGTRRNQAGPTTRTDVLTNGSEQAATFAAALRLDVHVTMTSRKRKLARGLTVGSPGRDAPEPSRLVRLHLGEQDVRLRTAAEFTLDDAGKERLDEIGAPAPGPETAVAAEGIGDLAGLVPAPATGQAVRDWQLVETVGDGQPLRDLAFGLLSRAAARGRAGHEDPALATEGLAPRLAIEERLSPQAITASLRQAASSGWVVKNLRYPRRLAALNGAVGTRLALANPRLLHEGAGPGTETFVLGGHQAAGQQGTATTNSVQFGVTGMESGTHWRAAEGLSGHRSWGESRTEATALSGTVERNAHTPRKAPLYLVLCDLLVTMVAEVKVTGGGPYTASAARTLPATAAVWLTAGQLRAAGVDLPESARKALKADGPGTGGRPAAGDTGARERAADATATGNTAPSDRTATGGTAERERAATGAGNTAARDQAATGAADTAAGSRRQSAAALPASLPLGFGMIEDLPAFVPLLEGLRANLGTRHRSLAAELLPRQQLKDRNDNVQRLLRVLDRDGAAGLLGSAMDGGVTVELFDGRRTPYWAVFKVTRLGDGVTEGAADDGRDMEYITSAVAQEATAREQGATTGAELTVGAGGRPDGGAGQLKSTGAAGGLGIGRGASHRQGFAARGQLGMKTVAEAKTARSTKLRLPVTATLELYEGDRRIGLASTGRTAFTYRILDNDLKALARVAAPRRTATTAPPPGAQEARPARLGAWRALGAKLPMEAQVNGFQGAPAVRRLVTETVGAAGGDPRYREKGQSAAYTLNEALSTEWLTAALPLLTSSGVDLPPVHATGIEGQDLHVSLHARLRRGRVLGVGDKMTFETVGQSSLDAPRPTQTDGQSSHGQGRSALGRFGGGLVDADQFRLNQLTGTSGGSGGAADGAVNASGSMPLHKPKLESVLVQFSLGVRVVARVDNRVRPSRTATAVRELSLPQPVVVRMPAPMVRHMLTTQAAYLLDPADHLGLLGLRRAAAPPPPPN